MENAKTRMIVLLVIFLTLLTALPVSSQQLPPRVSLDNLDYMAQFPPTGDKIVNLTNYYKYPQMVWAFQHMREIARSRNISRGDGPVYTLPMAERNLDEFIFEDDKGQKITLAEWQKRTYTDALVVLHKGKLVYERYYHKGAAERPHLLYSVTKSFTGLLASELIQEGKLDPNALVPTYVPELAASAWGDMKVQDVLDMTGAVKFREVYRDFTSDIFTYSFAMGSLQAPPNYAGPKTICDFLTSLEKGGEHGAGFVYRTIHSDVLGWIISRITGKHFADLISERIWQKLGMEKDAYILIDPVGTPWQGSGLCATARDLARFAEMVRRGGELNGQRIFAKEAIDEVRKGADREKFKASGMTFRPGYSYHNQWWVLHNADGAFEASGIFGQMIHINPGAEMVVVKLSSHPVPGAGFTHPLTLRAWEALAKAVRQ